MSRRANTALGFEHRRGRSVAILPQRSDDDLLKELLESLFEVVSPFGRPPLVHSSARTG